MFLSKAPSGFYYLYFEDELGNRRKRSTKCTYKADALKFLQQFKISEDDKRSRLKKQLLSQFLPDFLNYSKSIHTEKTQRCFKVAFRELIRIIGDIPLHKISIREIEAFLSIKKAEASEWTARKYYISLASAFETALRWKCIPCNPFRNIEKPKIREYQPAYFMKDEFRKLLVTIQDRDFKELCFFAVLTGLRLGEIISLEWSQIDFVRKVILVQNTKTFTTKSKKNRTVPMNDIIWKMLAVRKENASSELIFHLQWKKLSEEYVSKNFKRYIRKAGLNDRLHFHSLRHTFASWLVQDGVSIYVVKDLLGHSDVKTTQIYSHLQPESLHAEVNKISVSMN